MKRAVALVALLLVAAVAIVSGPAFSSDEKKPEEAKAMPTADEQVAGLEAMCAASAEARVERHAESSLFDRLGGEEKIHAMLKEVVRLHNENETIAYLMEGVDGDELARKVAEFVISGTGGPAVYEGRELKESHAHLKLTNDTFMAAGHDVIQAMKNLGHGENEINEVVCILVSLRDQVVLDESGAKE
jgi:hemoglobin